jgi:ketosteroid isomerase-like protein
MTRLEDQHRELLVRLFVAFNRHDRSGVMSCMTEDVVFDTAAGPEPFGRRIVGTVEVGMAFERVWTDMPNAGWICTEHSVFGDRGLSEWIFSGIGRGGRIEAEGCDLFRFRDRKISHKSAFRKDRPLQAVNLISHDLAEVR